MRNFWKPRESGQGIGYFPFVKTLYLVFGDAKSRTKGQARLTSFFATAAIHTVLPL